MSDSSGLDADHRVPLVLGLLGQSHSPGKWSPAGCFAGCNSSFLYSHRYSLLKPGGTGQKYGSADSICSAAALTAVASACMVPLWQVRTVSLLPLLPRPTHT